MRVLVEGWRAPGRSSWSDERGVLKALLKPLPGSRPNARSRSTPTFAGCRSWSTARCRSPPASRPTSRRWSRALDDPLRLAYLLASLLDMKAGGQAEAARGEQPLREARRGRDGAVARDRGARAEGPDRVAGREGDDRRAAQYVLRQQMKAIQSELGEGDSEARNCAGASPRRSCPNRSRPSRFARSTGSSG